MDDTRSVAGKELCGVERHRSWMRSVIAARSAAKFRVMIALGCCDAGGLRRSRMRGSKSLKTLVLTSVWHSTLGRGALCSVPSVSTSETVSRGMTLFSTHPPPSNSHRDVSLFSKPSVAVSAMVTGSKTSTRAILHYNVTTLDPSTYYCVKH